MAVLQVGPRSFRGVAVRNGSSLACLVFVLAVLVAAFVERSLPLAIYLLSFGHYVLYWVAFAFGTIAFDVFKRDAIAMKTVSVAALGVRLSAHRRSTSPRSPSSPAASC